MSSLHIIEEKYKKYSKDIAKWVPEGIIDIDLPFLQKVGLLHYHDPYKQDPHLTRYFHVLESVDKITLINDLFVVWIVPDKVGPIAVTYTMIALHPNDPHLELVYSTSGVYNSSRLVLRVLEKLLEDIQENEDVLNALGRVI